MPLAVAATEVNSAGDLNRMLCGVPDIYVTLHRDARRKQRDRIGRELGMPYLNILTYSSPAKSEGAADFHFLAKHNRAPDRGFVSSDGVFLALQMNILEY